MNVEMGFSLQCIRNPENSQDYAQKPQRNATVHEFGFCTRFYEELMGH
jgi:hypothetical protein